MRIGFLPIGGIIMDSSASPIFRNAMGGYNKKDVNDYLAKISYDFDEAINQKNEEIKALKAEIDSAKVDLTAMKDSPQNTEELDRANAVIAAQTEQLELSKKQIEQLTADLAAAQSKLQNYGELSLKLEQYETMTSRMGEIYMEATANADRIRTEARESADALIAKTDSECRQRRAELEKQLNEFASVRKDEIVRMLNETQSEINSILAIFGEKSRALAGESVDAALEGFKTDLYSPKA